MSTDAKRPLEKARWEAHEFLDLLEYERTCERVEICGSIRTWGRWSKTARRSVSLRRPVFRGKNPI